jgi:ferrochelatase
MNYGGPEKAQDCRPYLRNIFMDPDLIPIPGFVRPLAASLVSRRRAPILQKNYEAMGGYSPTLHETSVQAEALERALGEGFRCFVGMRYWRPFIGDVCEDIVREGFGRIVLLPIYPHESRTTTGSSIREARRCLRRLGYGGQVVQVRSFWDEPGYLGALCGQLLQFMGRLPEDTRVLFSAHGLPVSIARNDPYPGQVLDTVLTVCGRTGIALEPLSLPGVEDRCFAPAQDARWRGALAWQSKVGPAKWLEPSVEQTLHRWASEKVESVAVVPVAFVNEHSETLYELDVLYGGQAKALGMQYARVPTLGVAPAFIQGLASLVKQACRGKNGAGIE